VGPADAASEWYCESVVFEPDIVALDKEIQEFVLVVEVKTTSTEFEFIECQLKRYMADMHCPVGLFVTPERLRIYRNRYLGPKEESIVLMGQFDVTGVFKFKPSEAPQNVEPAFQNFVQEWLENLGTEAGISALPDDLRRAAQLYILPAIAHGTIRAGHARTA